MTREEILDLLSKNKPYLEEKMGLKSIALFGSWAHGNACNDSDIDLLVELKKPKYTLLMDLILFLEKLTGRKVDVVRKGPHLREKFLKSIQKDLIYA